MSELTVGDRVIQPGLKFRDEPDRRGEIVEVYWGLQNAVGHRQKFWAVRWDDRQDVVERGYIAGGQLQREPPTVTRMLGM